MNEMSRDFSYKNKSISHEDKQLLRNLTKHGVQTSINLSVKVYVVEY